jgi:CBS-domain-containing membrane protein
MPDRSRRLSPPVASDLMRDTDLLIPLGMSIGAARSLLDAVGADVAPVVDSRGRCVGVITGADCRRSFHCVEPEVEAVTKHRAINGAATTNEVRHHITGRFAAATMDAGVQELLDRLDTAEDPFLVILDWQARPRGIVCALDVLAAVSNSNWSNDTRMRPAFAAAH